MKSANRPVYLNLQEFSFPATAVASLLHRISGVLLFVALPLLIYGLDLSLQGAAGMATLQAWWSQLMVRLATALAGWALLHHWLAGWRFMLIDVGIGVAVDRARLTARLLNLASLIGLLTLLAVAL